MRHRFVLLLEQLRLKYARGRDGLVLLGRAAPYACLLPIVMDNVDHSFAWNHPVKPAGQALATWTAPRLSALHCLDWNGATFDQGGML
jgi:hypothetical protein